jgi:hypothetical protein
MTSSSSAGGLVKLPNRDRAVVELAKVTDYLLNPSHPDNGGKARFFGDAGFSARDPETLTTALRRIAASENVVIRTESRHGVKFVLDGMLERPGARAVTVRTVWIVESGRDAPRLVTAYPLGRERG